MHSGRREAIISADSMNGLVEYNVSVEFDNESDHALREAFRQVVVDAVRAEHGVTPEGVGYLADLRTVRIVRL